ncbi:L-serine dehydratase, iron-sulfur-dependent subunit alpha [Clostridium sp. W14A]|nr:L-serine dehydratase, iron-sulfur-dependent subunit alpha [Clostridium sp. W14A]
MAFTSVKQLLAAAKERSLPLWEIILDEDVKDRGTVREDSLRQMNALWSAMKSAGVSYRAEARSKSGLVGGDGGKMEEYAKTGNGIVSGFFSEVIAQALQMGECNACMKRIVAAPTAGSCGVLPAVLIPFAKANKIEDRQIISALFVAAGFGQIIASRASISGAEGGCQAEIGSASAMAAAAVVSLKGGTPEMCANACAMALMNLLGLVCDPVAGLVEIPCVKRNVVGAVNAISCADMSLAGIGSAIPPDEVIDAMREVGDMMPAALKETGTGGLAATPAGITAAKRIHGNI